MGRPSAPAPDRVYVLHLQKKKKKSFHGGGYAELRVGGDVNVTVALLLASQPLL